MIRQLTAAHRDLKSGSKREEAKLVAQCSQWSAKAKALEFEVEQLNKQLSRSHLREDLTAQVTATHTHFLRPCRV